MPVQCDERVSLLDDARSFGSWRFGRIPVEMQPRKTLPAGELEEVLLMQHSVTAKAGNGAKRRTAVDAGFLRRLEQPLVQKEAAMLAVFVRVEA